jgi:hypothetical protein
MSEQLLGIKEAASKLGLSELYVRNAIRSGKLETTMVPVAPDSKTMKHQITVKALEAWRASTSNRSRRDDGRGRFILYATEAELADLRKMLANAKLAVIVQKPVYGNGKSKKAKQAEPTAA